MGNKHFSKEETSISANEDSQAFKNRSITLNVNDVSNEDETQDNTRPTLLIVEDNNTLRNYLNSMLTKDINILHATNGKTGRKLAKKNLPV